MSRDHTGTGFAPEPLGHGAYAGSGKKGAGEAVIRSACEVPRYAAPVSLCLRVLPERRGTRFTIQILDLATGHVLDERAPQRLAELPATLARLSRWAFYR